MTCDFCGADPAPFAVVWMPIYVDENSSEIVGASHKWACKACSSKSLSDLIRSG